MRRGFTQYVADKRSDYGIASLPFVCVKIGPMTGQEAIDHPYASDLRVIQSRIFLSRVAVVQVEDATLYDEVHLDGTSLEKCGRRAADAMRWLGA